MAMIKLRIKKLLGYIHLVSSYMNKQENTFRSHFYIVIKYIKIYLFDQQQQQQQVNKFEMTDWCIYRDLSHHYTILQKSAKMKYNANISLRLLLQF